MSQLKYHGAIEIKDIVSFFLRRLQEVKPIVSESEEKELLNKLEEVKILCKDFYDMASKIAEIERPPERVLIDPDRGINEFLERDCGCDDSCSGGNCGGCGGCP